MYHDYIYAALIENNGNGAKYMQAVGGGITFSVDGATNVTTTNATPSPRFGNKEGEDFYVEFTQDQIGNEEKIVLRANLRIANRMTAYIDEYELIGLYLQKAENLVQYYSRQEYLEDYQNVAKIRGNLNYTNINTEIELEPVKEAKYTLQFKKVDESGSPLDVGTANGALFEYSMDNGTTWQEVEYPSWLSKGVFQISNIVSTSDVTDHILIREKDAPSGYKTFGGVIGLYIYKEKYEKNNYIYYMPKNVKVANGAMYSDTDFVDVYTDKGIESSGPNANTNTIKYFNFNVDYVNIKDTDYADGTIGVNIGNAAIICIENQKIGNRIFTLDFEKIDENNNLITNKPIKFLCSYDNKEYTVENGKFSIAPIEIDMNKGEYDIVIKLTETDSQGYSMLQEDITINIHINNNHEPTIQSITGNSGFVTCEDTRFTFNGVGANVNERRTYTINKPIRIKNTKKEETPGKYKLRFRKLLDGINGSGLVGAKFGYSINGGPEEEISSGTGGYFEIPVDIDNGEDVDTITVREISAPSGVDKMMDGTITIEVHHTTETGFSSSQATSKVKYEGTNNFVYYRDESQGNSIWVQNGQGFTHNGSNIWTRFEGKTSDSGITTYETKNYIQIINEGTPSTSPEPDTIPSTSLDFEINKYDAVTPIVEDSKDTGAKQPIEDAKFKVKMYVDSFEVIIKTSTSYGKRTEIIRENIPFVSWTVNSDLKGFVDKFHFDFGNYIDVVRNAGRTLPVCGWTDTYYDLHGNPTYPYQHKIEWNGEKITKQRETTFDRDELIQKLKEVINLADGEEIIGCSYKISPFEDGGGWEGNHGTKTERKVRLEIEEIEPAKGYERIDGTYIIEISATPKTYIIHSDNGDGTTENIECRYYEFSYKEIQKLPEKNMEFRASSVTTTDRPHYDYNVNTITTMALDLYNEPYDDELIELLKKDPNNPNANLDGVKFDVEIEEDRSIAVVREIKRTQNTKVYIGKLPDETTCSQWKGNAVPVNEMGYSIESNILGLPEQYPYSYKVLGSEKNATRALIITYYHPDTKKFINVCSAYWISGNPASANSISVKSDYYDKSISEWLNDGYILIGSKPLIDQKENWVLVNGYPEREYILDTQVVDYWESKGFKEETTLPDIEYQASATRHVNNIGADKDMYITQNEWENKIAGDWGWQSTGEKYTFAHSETIRETIKSGPYQIPSDQTVVENGKISLKNILDKEQIRNNGKIVREGANGQEQLITFDEAEVYYIDHIRPTQGTQIINISEDADSVPEGYDRAEGILTLKVDKGAAKITNIDELGKINEEDDFYNVNENTKTKVHNPNVMEDDEIKIQVTIYNEGDVPTSHDYFIEIKKFDSISRQEIAGGTFKVEGQVNGENIAFPYTISGTIEEGEEHYYKFSEVTPPEGHIKISGYAEFTVRGTATGFEVINQADNFKYEGDNQKYCEAYKSPKGIYLYIYNKPDFEPNDAQINFKIKKVDSKTNELIIDNSAIFAIKIEDSREVSYKTITTTSVEYPAPNVYKRIIGTTNLVNAILNVDYYWTGPIGNHVIPVATETLTQSGYEVVWEDDYPNTATISIPSSDDKSETLNTIPVGNSSANNGRERLVTGNGIINIVRAIDTSSITGKSDYVANSIQVSDVSTQVITISEEKAPKYYKKAEGDLVLIVSTSYNDQGVLETSISQSGETNFSYDWEIDSDGIAVVNIKNERKMIEVSGNVWEDLPDQDKTTGYEGTGLDGQKGKVKIDDKEVFEEAVPGMIVKLHTDNPVYDEYKDSDDNKKMRTTTNDNGHYSFTVPMGTEYYVEFVYNGYNYQHTYYTPYDDEVKDNGKTMPGNLGSHATETDTERKTFNERLVTITNKTAINGVKVGHEDNNLGPTILGPNNSDIYKISAYIGPNGNSGYRYAGITTGKFEFGTDENVESYQNLNLGITKRERADLRLAKDLYKAELTINGKTVTSNYNSMNLTRTKEGDSYWEIAVRDSDVYYLNEYNLPIRPSDLNHINNALVTYVISIYNEGSLTTKVNEIIDKYDSNYEFVDAYLGNRYGNEIANVGKDQSGKQVRIQLSEDKKILAPGQYMYIYVTLKMINNIAYNNIYGNKAEITSYSTYYRDGALSPNYKNENTYKEYEGGKIAGRIDIDSDPENDKEDDYNTAPNVKITENPNPRKISGSVWEDQKEPGLSIGDGMKELGEDAIGGVTVELWDKNTSQIAKVFNGEEWVDATQTTQGDGKYEFSGLLPGNYFVKFIYGDDSVATKYNAQDYKSTKYVGTILATGFNPNTPDEDDEYKETLGYYYSDARDIWGNESTPGTRQYINKMYSGGDNGYIQNSEITDLTNSNGAKGQMQAKSGIIYAGVEKIDIVEYGEVPLQYEYADLDFGLIERPKAELELIKKVTNVQVVLADGRVMIDATENEPGSYVLWIENSDSIILTLDEETMHGARVVAKYSIQVKNIGEEDYASKKFYYTGTKEDGEEPVKTTVGEIIDYPGAAPSGDNTAARGNLQFVKNASEENDKWEIKTWNTLHDEGYVKILKEGADNTENILKQYPAIITRNVASDANINSALKPNESMTLENITLSSLLGSSQKETYRFDNIAEILTFKNDVGRRLASSIVGNQSPDEEPTELDSGKDDGIAKRSSQTILILPPFGQKPTYYVIAAGVLVILAGGIFFIKKKVIKK